MNDLMFGFLAYLAVGVFITPLSYYVFIWCKGYKPKWGAIFAESFLLWPIVTIIVIVFKYTNRCISKDN